MERVTAESAAGAVVPVFGTASEDSVTVDSLKTHTPQKINL